MAESKRKRASTHSPDRISQLPVPILQHILSFLPIKQIVQTASLSKSWLAAWNTFPVFDFPFDFFLSLQDDCGDYSDEENQTRQRKVVELFRFVEEALLSRRRDMVTVEKFSVQLIVNTPELASMLDRWIGYLVDCKIQHLYLRIAQQEQDYGTYKLPWAVLSAPSLMRLSSDCFKLEIPKGGIMKLSSLKYLSLHQFEATDEVIQNLVSGCPVVEYMEFGGCSGFNALHLPDLLKLMKFGLGSSNALDQLKIEASSLHTLELWDELPHELVMVSSKKLKSLCLGFSSATDKWVHDCLSKFPFLEDLTLRSCYMLGSIEISSCHLKTLFIDGCYHLVECKIDVPCLSQFMYDGVPVLLSISSTDLVVPELRLHLDWFGFDIPFCAKLIEFLAKFNHYSVPSMEIWVHSGFHIPEELRQALSPLSNNKVVSLVVHTSHLNLVTTGIVDSLLWIFPHIKSLSIQSEEGSEYNLTFSYGDLPHDKEIPCCKSLPVSCWQQCIKSVRIEETIPYTSNNPEFVLVNQTDHFFNEDILENMASLLDGDLVEDLDGDH